MRNLFVALLALTASVSWSADGPANYPNSLLEAPATLTEPPAPYVRIGLPQIKLEKTTLSDVANRTGGILVAEGRGLFRRNLLCLTGTENGRPMRLWLIATDSDRVSEAQLEWIPEGEEASRACKALPPKSLPIRLGKVGLGMTQKEVLDFAGPPSMKADDGWHYWFSQRFLHNARGWQELELNWLGVLFDKDGRAVRLFNSQVTNP